MVRDVSWVLTTLRDSSLGTSIVLGRPAELKTALAASKHFDARLSGGRESGPGGAGVQREGEEAADAPAGTKAGGTLEAEVDRAMALSQRFLKLVTSEQA